MDIDRIYSDVTRASLKFDYIETHPTGSGEVFVKAAFQPSAYSTYIAEIYFTNYPYQMPKVYITKPSLYSNCPHIYEGGYICYLHPNMWNPGRHDLTFVLGRTAKWLSKYEVWKSMKNWPGASMRH